MESEYVLIPKSTLNALELNNEHILTPEEMLKISVYKDLFAKFIRQKAVAMLMQQKAQLTAQIEEVNKKLRKFNQR